jgi:hypothetical protein
MSISEYAAKRNPAGGAASVALGAIGLACTLLILNRPRAHRHSPREEGRTAFAAYLRDHLMGSDAATQTVDQLERAYRGTPEGGVFASLREQFLQERTIVESLLHEMGASELSIKRLAGRAAGVALRVAGPGERGELSLFRTLEALQIGVQGKRCLWRAVQVLPERIAGRRSFADLEADAIRQWELLERCRSSLVRRTFAV